jgi:hypothetical protein
MNRGEPSEKPLTPKQTAAIAALLSHRRLDEAAEACGLSTSTLQRWMVLPQFQEALQQGSRNLLGAAISDLLRATSRATEVLIELLESEREGTRLKAAIAIYDRAAGAIEFHDLEVRLTALERELKHQRPARRYS